MVWKLTFLTGSRESEWFYVFATKKEAVAQSTKLHEDGQQYTFVPSVDGWTEPMLEPCQYCITKQQSVYFGA